LGIQQYRQRAPAGYPKEKEKKKGKKKKKERGRMAASTLIPIRGEITRF